jgi:hypothetical protein
MPWTSRPRRNPAARVRHGVRRWRYDHSEDLRAFWIGACVVMATIAALAALRLIF